MIQEELEKQIISRYFYKAGEIEAEFDNDKDVLKAIEILEDMDTYKSILSGK